MKESDLGMFVRPFEINGFTFYIRGLTVGEYTDLLMSGAMKNMTSRTWFDIAYTGIVDWSGVVDEFGNTVAYSAKVLDTWTVADEGVEAMMEDTIIRVGQEIFQRMTVPDDEEIDKFIASTRFLHFRSEPKNKSIAESFNCEICIKRGMAKSRPCGRFTDEEIDRKHKELNNIPLEDIEGAVKNPATRMKNRYKASSSVKRPRTEEQVAKRKQGAISVGGFQYPECPVSYIDDWISSLSSILYNCAKSNLTFFSGGVADQSYKLYQLQRIVAGEAGQIESEEMDKIHKKR